MAVNFANLPRLLAQSPIDECPWRLNGAYAGWASDRSPTIGREAAMGGIRDRPRRGLSAGGDPDVDLEYHLYEGN
jgi:hypothetical protein